MVMAQLVRGTSKSGVFGASALNATRGGGGSWHRPDPKPYPLYKYTRRYRLEDINTVLYSDFAPEFHMHLHSMWVQNTRRGYALWLAYFFIVILPMWSFGRKLMSDTGAMLFPSVRAGEQHAHMAPAIMHHLRSNNCENAPDKFGRLNAGFYKNFTRQDNTRKPDVIDQLEKHF